MVRIFDRAPKVLHYLREELLPGASKPARVIACGAAVPVSQASSDVTRRFDCPACRAKAWQDAREKRRVEGNQ